MPGLQVGDIKEAEPRMAISMDAIGVESAPTIAFKQMREVRQDRDDLRELADSLGDGSPLNRDVAWSISVPVPYGTDTSRAIGVLIVDALFSNRTQAGADGGAQAPQVSGLAEQAAVSAQPRTEDASMPGNSHANRTDNDEFCEEKAESDDGADQPPQSVSEDPVSFSLANELLTMDNVYEVVLRLGISLCRARNE